MANKEKLTAEQKRWRAEDDAYILAQARVVESDVERFNAATKVAQQKANNLKKEAAAMQKVANSKRKK